MQEARVLGSRRGWNSDDEGCSVEVNVIRLLLSCVSRLS
jgi:hypothetical protein